MADLIDRAALLEKLELLAKHEDPFRETVIRGVMFTISNETAVDAVEVVRCIKCELHDSCYAEDVFKTARMDLEKAFCCLGSERRTDG